VSLRRRLPRTSTAALAVPPLLVFAVGCWVISPRFSISGPSLIDDWYAIKAAPTDLHKLLTLTYHVDQRFNPGWIFWNWVQWRVPGAPRHMLGPNLLGVARLALLVFGMTACSFLIVSSDRDYPFQRALLCAVPALIVVTVPGFAVDLARFGPQEPALTGGMLLGGALLYSAARRLPGPAGELRLWPLSIAVAAFALWTYGVLQKETSVCALFLLVLLIPYGRETLAGLRRREPVTVAAAALAGAALLPLVLVLYEVIEIVRRGSLIYGGHVKTGGGAVSTFIHGVAHMHEEMHSRIGFALFAVVVAGVAASLWRRRFDWTLFAILIVGLASFEMSFQTGIFTSRYYLPTIALLAVGSARVVRALPVVPRYASTFVVFGLILVSANGAYLNVRSWADGDQLGDDLVTATAAATHNGCHLTISGVDLERSEAIPFLLRLKPRPRTCRGLARYVLLGPTETRSAAAVCETEAPALVGEWRVSNAEPIQLYRCNTL
jgi:hypothetical protein